MFQRSPAARSAGPGAAGRLVAAGLALALGVDLPAAPAQAAGRPGPILGDWLTQHGDAKLRFAACGAALCGKIVWLKEPNDDSGRPKTDVGNSDPGKRSRPLMGLTIFTDLKPDGDQWSGQVYNAEDGKDYRVSIKRVDDGHAKVNGCVLGGLFCGDEVWTRG
jgi:uncharacterized protein (DUF2147 family)